MRKLPLLFMVLLTLFSCREPDCPEGSEDQARLPESFTNFFYFKKGSYWVLQNEKNGRLDSIWVNTGAIFRTFGTFIGNNPGTQCPLTTRFFGSFASLDTSKQRFNEIYLEMIGSKVDNYLRLDLGSSSLNKKNDSIIVDIRDKLYRQIFWKQDSIGYGGINDKTFLNKKSFITFRHNQIISGKKYNRIFQITPLALYDTLFFAERVGIIKSYRMDTAYKLIRFHLN